MAGTTWTNVVDGRFSWRGWPRRLVSEPICIKKTPTSLRFAPPGTVQITPCRLTLLVGHVCSLGSHGRNVLTAGIARIEGVRNQVVRIPCHAVKLASIEDNDIALAIVVEMIPSVVIVIVDVVFGHKVHICFAVLIACLASLLRVSNESPCCTSESSSETCSPVLRL